jgi:hypothetical protein
MRRRIDLSRALASVTLVVCLGAACSDDDPEPRVVADGAAGASGSAGASADAAFDAAPTGQIHRFRRITLTTEFLSEGASFGDFDRDGATDVVAGPYWYKGPGFTEKHAIYPAPPPFDVTRYSNNFFAFVYDFDADGFQDVLFVAFPGDDATWYQNPGSVGPLWTARRAFDYVDNEAPDFTDLTGDGKPELVFNTDPARADQGRLGWAAPNWSSPGDPWTFHALSPVGPYARFTHGLGVGDVNRDGRMDVLEKGAWWEQPASLASDPVWTRHAAAFTDRGGAQMFTDDVDADGDADVITSIAAHEYGLSWFEQQKDGSFVEHVIVSAAVPTGDVVILEPHGITLHDIDGDGDRDIVAGERFWGHYSDALTLDDPARVYWFELVRSGGTARYFPHLMDAASGVGTQVVVGDVTGDGLPDVVTANKRGAFVLVHEIDDGTKD